MSTQAIRFVDLASIQAVIDHATAYDAVWHALATIAAGGVEAPEELAFKLANNGEIHIKGARLQSQPWIVFKLATGSFPQGANSGCSFLLDAESGEPRVILNDAGWLTEMRTAAAGAVATDLLAPRGPLSVAILGTGFQARYQLAALRARREVRDIKVWGRSTSKTRDLAVETSATPCKTVAEAVANVDVIVTTTSSTSPILFEADLSNGVHITAMGADMVGKREIGAEILDRATLIAADDLATCARVGELQHAPQHVQRATTLAALVDQHASHRARRSDADLTIADLCGIGAYDAAIASAAVAALQID